MNWIHAYINAIKTNLPRHKRDDIALELETLIEETLEADTGKRPSDLSEAETLNWLKTRDHPALVAMRYQDRRTLIDEDSFPLYKLTVHYAIIALTVVYILLEVLSAFSSQGGGPSISVTRLAGNILHSSLLAFASITLVFHFFGRHFNARKCLAKWNPKELPDPAKRWEMEPYADSIAGLIFTGIFLLFINGLLTGIVSEISNSTVIRFHLVESAATLLPWINATLIASMGLSALMILRPQWSTATLALHAAIALASAILALQLQSVSPMFELLTESTSHPEQLDRLTRIVSTSGRTVLTIIAIVSLYELVRDLWRMIQLGGRRLLP